mmetsp:Transcript_11605/g.27021  ORF Transcript_11605/g.27021 Transcript_11605/m.27021 type:complete len:104 (-) Transcript_11605:145-456(-)
MQHQVLSNMIDFGMEPQMALDAPRFCIKAPIAKKPDCDAISVEDGVSRTVVGELREMGHTLGDPLVGHERALFGRGQIIRRIQESGVLWAGSDPRADGCAMGW